MKAVAYCRVSTEDQGEISLPDQEQKIREYAKRKNWEIGKIYSEKETGIKFDRPIFQEMLQDAKEGKFEKILFVKWDRFSRSPKDTLTIHDDLKKIGVALVCTEIDVDTGTAIGELLMGQLSIFSKYEHSLIRSRTQMGQLAKIKKNEIFIGPRPHGYIWNKETKKLEICEEEAETIRRIFELYGIEKLSLSQVAERLSQEGRKNRHGNLFTLIHLRRILASDFYVTGTHNFRKSKILNQKTQEREERPREEWVPYPAPSILDKSLWDAVQKRRQYWTCSPKKKELDNFILRGLLKCSCGELLTTMRGIKKKDGSGNYRYYVCFSKTVTPNKKFSWLGKKEFKPCNMGYVKADQVEEEVLGNIAMALIHPENTIQILEDKIDKEKLEKYRKRISQITDRMASEERNYKKVLNLYLEEEIDKKRLKEKQGEILASIEKLKETKMDLESQLSGVSEIERQIEGIKKSRKELSQLSLHFLETLQEMTPQEKQELMTHIFDKRGIIVHPMSEEKARGKGYEVTITKEDSKWPIKNYILQGEGNFDFSRLASSFKFLKNYKKLKYMSPKKAAAQAPQVKCLVLSQKETPLCR